MISIEAFPLLTIQNVPDARPNMAKPSSGSERDAFSGVVRGLNSESSSRRSPSGETGKREDLKKNNNDSPSLLGDSSAATRLVDIEKNILAHPTPPSPPQTGGDIQGYPGQGQVGQTPPGNSMQAILGNILSQLGFTQEVLNNSEQFTAILTKLGLDADQVAHLLEMQSATPEGEGKEAFLARLLSALEEKGILPTQAKEISEMLAALKVETNNLPSTEVKQDSVVKDLLVQLGMNPEEAEAAVKEGELSVAELKKILAQLGRGAEEGHEAVKGEKVLLGDLKNILTQLGVKTENLNALIEGIEGGSLESLPKGLVEMLDKAMNTTITVNSSAVPLQGELPVGEGNGGGQENTGNGDFKGEGQLAVVSTGGKTVAGAGQDRGDFEQILSRISSRGSVAQKVVGQIVEGARIQVENGETKAKIFLNPPSLGKLNLQIITREDQVRVTFFAENSQVKEIIENNLTQLRQSFAQQGLRVENFDVFVDYHPNGQPTGRDNLFSGFRDQRGETDGFDHDEDVARGGARTGISGNHRVDLFI